MYKKHILCSILSGVLLSACSVTEDITLANIDAPYPKATIGVSLSSTEHNPFLQGAYQSYEKIGKDNADLEIILESANSNPSTQDEQLESMQKKGAKALVIDLADTQKGADIIQKYCDSMILVFFNQNPGDKALANCKTAYFVNGDVAQAGILQGLQVLEAWKKHPDWDKNKDGKIQFAILEGIPNQSGVAASTKWEIGIMEDHPALGVPVEQIFSDYAMLQQIEAKNLVTKWAMYPQFSQVEVILAANDSMALGAIEVLKEKQLKLPVFGIDGSEGALEAIKNGDMVATVFNDHENQAKVAVRIAANLVAGLAPTTNIPYNMHYKVVQVPYQNVDKK